MIADHLRASAFLIADGVLPSNEGRGYVLRRIMRRAMRHAELLGAKEPLMWKLVPVLTREMGQAYPELLRAEALITETLKLEETRFRRTLERGLAILDEKSKDLRKGAMFDGETAFTLYDTYGFPLDLTQDALRSRGISVDIASFTDAMDRQREKARASWAGSGDAAQETVWFALREKIGPTEFLGYETESAEGIVAALVKDGKEVSELKKGETGTVVVNQTPFYGESGGQVGDTGEIRREGVRATVSDTQKKAGDVMAHMVTVGQGRSRLAIRCCWRSTTRAVTPFGRTIRPHIFCMKRCGRCWANTSRRRARSLHPTGCGSISPIRSQCRLTNLKGLRTLPTTRFFKTGP